jgi:large subunit ribosomal protein L3
MVKRSRPRKGSMGYWHRKRAKSVVPSIKTWPSGGDSVELQGFAGYKVGMTHAFSVDYRPTSTTSGQEVVMPVSVVEAPPIKIAAIRGYSMSPYGYKTLGEVWSDEIDPMLKRRINISQKGASWDVVSSSDEISAIVHTLPNRVPALPSKTPEIMEIRIGGGDMPARLEYSKTILGKELKPEQVFKTGDMIDVIAVTKGKGFQSRVKRFDTKLLSHKNSKHRRMIGTQGPWNPSWIRSSVPSDGQMGFHKRTEYNKRILKIGDNPEEINPLGGFAHYGMVRNSYLLLHGSIPGPAKRMVRLRDSVRYTKGVKAEQIQLTYVSKGGGGYK